MDHNRFYVKIRNPIIIHIGKIIDCGCEVVDVNWPESIINCCKQHESQIKKGLRYFPNVSPYIVATKDNKIEWNYVHSVVRGEGNYLDKKHNNIYNKVWRKNKK